MLGSLESERVKVKGKTAQLKPLFFTALSFRYKKVII